jgi:hypothetical protein
MGDNRPRSSSLRCVRHFQIIKFELEDDFVVSVARCRFVENICSGVSASLQIHPRHDCTVRHFRRVLPRIPAVDRFAVQTTTTTIITHDILKIVIRDGGATTDGIVPQILVKRKLRNHLDGIISGTHGWASIGQANSKRLIFVVSILF